jgi:exopolysaccharide biosynthesis protein
MTLGELADHMARLGCTEALNLDGGGSSTLWARGQVMNTPCEGSERAMGNALLITLETPENGPR